MRFSTVLASFTVLATASARTIPPFLSDVGLPQIATNVSTIMNDLNALDTTLSNLTSAIQTPPASGVIQAVLDIGTIIGNIIGVQMANHQAFLDAQELPVDLVFSPENSSAILSTLKDRIFPHAQTALDMLKGLKTKNYVGQLTTDRAILGYVQNIRSEFTQFSDLLVKHIDPASLDPVRAALGDIGKLLNATVDVYVG